MSATFSVIDSRPALRAASLFLQQGIEAIHAKGMSQSTTFGDVYMGLAAGALRCTLIHEEGALVGFFITEQHTEHNGDTCLYLAYVYVAPTVNDLTPDVVDAFDQEAKAAGCARIRFKTVRNGWQRRLAPHGFTPTAIELTKQVQ